MLVLWLVRLAALLLSVDGACTPLEISQVSRIRNLSSKTRVIRVGVARSYLQLLESVSDSQSAASPRLLITTDPPLVQGEDFELFSFAFENAIPTRYRVRASKVYIGLKLLPGKTWVANTYASPTSFYITSAHVCSGSQSTPSAVSRGNWRLIAMISSATEQKACPKLVLPGAGAQLSSLLREVLEECNNPWIVKSMQLDWRKVSSVFLLSLEPPMMLVDGSDQSLAAAARSVDSFLAAHAVLEVAWEPYDMSEPRWWVLMPRPPGMPGHLFAMLDFLQWKHPFLSKASKHAKSPICNSTIKGCIPGCPKTKIIVVTGSGYGASAWHLFHKLSEGLRFNLPIQAAPMVLGHRIHPPLWGGVLGWAYTFQGCSTHFLDCYFLDHSPCPPIRMDVRDNVGESKVVPTRLSINESDTSNQFSEWWGGVMGRPSKTVPEASIRGIRGPNAEQVLYTYLFRPKYEIRKIVHERVAAFALNGACAVMHVRRGDSIMDDGSNARAYIRIDEYLRPALPLMGAMGIRTVLLLSDSQGAVDEAQRCAKEHPEVCEGITFRSLNKTRWVGAEGGWDNPYPSGDSRVELMDIQLELALSHKCSLLVTGESNYAERIRDTMACGFPLPPRGSIPHRCIAPPHIQLKQSSFGCAEGNALECAKDNDSKFNKGGNVHLPLNDPANMSGTNFSMTADAFPKPSGVWLFNPTMQFRVLVTRTKKSEAMKRLYLDACNAQFCMKIDHGNPYERFCISLYGKLMRLLPELRPRTWSGVLNRVQEAANKIARDGWSLLNSAL